VGKKGSARHQQKEQKGNMDSVTVLSMAGAWGTGRRAGQGFNITPNSREGMVASTIDGPGSGRLGK